MPYDARIFRALIASPADTADSRDIVENEIHAWNAQHGEDRGALFQPWRWETDAVPRVGAHPQTVLNSQGADASDVVFAIFDTRLGTPTASYLSGTVEEIDRADHRGALVHVYFSTAPLPRDADLDEIKRLREYKAQLAKTALYGDYSSKDELRRMVQTALTADIGQLHTPLVTESAEREESHPGEHRFLVQLQRERELNGYSSSGKPQYRTNLRLQITNRAEDDAQIESVASVGTTAFRIMHSMNGQTIHAGQMRELSAFRTMGGGDVAAIVRLAWSDSEGHYEKDFTVD